MVDSDSKDEDKDLDTSQDEDITHKLFCDLNRGLLRPPGDGNIIIINDSKEEELHMDDCTDTDATPSSLRVSPDPSPLPLVSMMCPMGCKMIVVTAAHPVGCKMIIMMVRMRLGLLRLLCKGVICRGMC
jgi:hypothetical protein